MKIAIVGATGFIGQPIFDEAVTRQHEVTALVRNPNKVVPHKRVTALELNVQNSLALTKLLNSHDAAVISLHYENQNLPQLIQAIKASSVQYTLFVGGAASLEVAPGVQLIDTPEFPEQWKATAGAARELLQILRGEKHFNWTYVSPSAFIEPGERTGKFRLGTDQLLINERGESRISTQDFAVAVLDELESPTNQQTRFTVGY
ncbi:NAD(P)-dependent oxidoreductase [Cellvibrio sp.]|uniref:NAD(P)-dependent oxidoreductase n=1 Tax=Cellvibrio sp. TaxID=1965322 RepID=UPI0039648306